MNILVVDDVEANIHVVESLLESYQTDEIKINIHTALSGEQALRTATVVKLDLVILDIQMPQMDGFEVAKYLKMNPKTKDIIIIFLTAAFKTEEFKKHGYEVGAIDYFTKPIEQFQFSNKIKLYLNFFLKSKRLDEEIERRIQSERLLAEQAKHAAMGEMIGAIAHQWRQPLNLLSLKIQNLEDFYEDGLIDGDFLEDYVDENLKTIDFMSKTIDDFRNFFRTDKTKRVFDVYDAANETLSMQSAFLASHKIQTQLLGERLEINGLKNELQQAILNLINNAKDALLENEIADAQITLTIDAAAKTIQVQDNAGGIPEHVMSRVFEPYFTTKEQGKGTGMGLYMSKMIVEDNMNGSLSVCNQGQGANFCIQFRD